MYLTAAVTTTKSLVRSRQSFLTPRLINPQPSALFTFYHFDNSTLFFLRFFFVFFFVLVNPIASQNHNAPQQNLSQNYSLPASTMQANSYDASSSFHNPSAVNNFNNFDQSNQFQMQYQQQSFDYQAGGLIQQQQQFIGQSSVNNGASSAYQHSINDLLVQPTATLQQNLFSSQDASAVSQSVSIFTINNFPYKF